MTKSITHCISLCCLLIIDSVFQLLVVNSFTTILSPLFSALSLVATNFYKQNNVRLCVFMCDTCAYKHCTQQKLDGSESANKSIWWNKIYS